MEVQEQLPKTINEIRHQHFLLVGYDPESHLHIRRATGGGYHHQMEFDVVVRKKSREDRQTIVFE